MRWNETRRVFNLLFRTINFKEIMLYRFVFCQVYFACLAHTVPLWIIYCYPGQLIATPVLPRIDRNRVGSRRLAFLRNSIIFSQAYRNVKVMVN